MIASQQCTTLHRIVERSRQPIDGASIAVFRIALGILLMVDAVRKGDHFFAPNEGDAFNFPYPGFEWLPSAGPWAGTLATVWFATGFLVAAGLFYRPAIWTALGLTCFGFLQSQEFYLNHYYLLVLLTFLMALTPANKAFSIDRLLFRERIDGKILSRAHLWLLKGQAEIVLIYAGVVKLNSDWLQLEPLRSWLRSSQDRVLFGALYESDIAVAVAAYGVILLHILGAPLLLWKPTRLAVFILYCSFHITNHNTFDIGIFPWMTIAMTTLFFDPGWPRRFLPSDLAPAALLQPARFGTASAFLAFVTLWLTSQALVPLRHYTYPGDVAWTYEGHQFSWRMKLVDRWSPGLVALVHLRDRDRILIPPLRKMMSRLQHDRVSTRPRLAHAMASQLARMVEQSHGSRDVAVHLYMPVGYNNREATLLIDPSADMLKASAAGAPPRWIIQKNDKPLRRIEEFSKRYRFPKTREMAAMMGLPKPVNCQRGPDGWKVCVAAGAERLSGLKP